ncbi:uncharacterized protein DEA37_0010237 [Paragonimus westermani]|uniref:Uncharacterized protein n=1 Tax=Paragonimus westermani TaxID=34504 RepID=A0A5J4NN77_9TREM|nr:uncharacterized protein DEA37_0010237 [Paragonimus westermani]
MESLANLFGGSLFTGIYNGTVAVFPGTVFLLDSVLHAVMLGAFIWMRVNMLVVRLGACQKGSKNIIQLGSEPVDVNQLPAPLLRI